MKDKTEDQIKKAIKVYYKNFVQSVSPPDCSTCHNEAILYDQCAGENYCDECLNKSLREDTESLFDLVAKFPEMEK
jgi:hypothetical protein